MRRCGFPAIVLVLLFAGGVLAQDDPGEKARAALDAGEPREALLVLAPALSKAPSDPALLALRGEARLDLSKVQDAKADLEKVARSSKEWSSKVAGLRARIEFLYANDDAARKLLEEAPEDDDDRKTLPLLMKGPFGERLGEQAALAQGRSSNKHYLVYSDVGITEDYLAKAKTGNALKPGPGVREGCRLLEIIYKAYETVFPFEKDARLCHRVYVFAKRDDYLAFAKSLGEDMEGADGFFRSDVRILAIDGEEFAEGKETFAENVKDTIFHEGFHQFVRMHNPGLPTWLDEGLAEYFGPSKVLSEGKLEVGVVKKTAGDDRTTRYEDVLALIKKKKAPRFAKLVQMTDDEFTSDEDALNDRYAQAWSVIHFLVSTPARRPLLVDYFKLLRQGKTREAAFAETFGKVDLDELDREWRKYVENL